MSDRMPALFVGHGSPMNAIEENVYSKNWSRIAKQIKRPDAILSVSAHWYTTGTKIMDTPTPRMVYDAYGFPDKLYQLKYSAKGCPEAAKLAASLIKKTVRVDNSWGIDHGTWSVLKHMYPDADIPVFQLSIDSLAPASAHYRIGQELASLRKQGIMIFGSGNVVHNLSRINWEMDGGNSWAVQFDKHIKNKIVDRKHEYAIHYDHGNDISAKLSVPTPEHFYPLLYILGASAENEKLTVFNESCTMGALSMTSYLFE
jgi:4,5-DOPA dioxygenase extradiol